MSQNHIGLDDLLLRNLAVEWFEGVALIQAVCRAVADRGDSARGFPDPSDISLVADGSVVVRRVPSGDGGAPVAARLLAEMARDSCPVQLRLLVSQATAVPAENSQLAEFSNALAFFERPDGRDILRQLYRRAVAAPAAPGATPSRDESEPSTDPSGLKRPADAKPKKRFGAVAAASALVIVIVALGSFLAFRLQNARTFGAVEAVQAVFQDLLGGAPADAGAPPIENLSEKPSMGRTNHASRRAKPSKLAASEPTSSWEVTMVPLRRPAAVELRTLPRTTENGIDGTEKAIRADPARVYSAADSEVTPPRAVYPQFPPAPPPSERASHTVIGLLLTEQGRVEKAQLRSVPKNVIEIMLLSAAKAWRFQPALVDGVPVRFQHYVVVTPEITGGRPF